MVLMPFILWGGLLVGIPVLVHLLHRQKVTAIAWGAMQFLINTPLKLKRRQRIDHWLLMMLRMAILFLLVMVLSRPILTGRSFSSETPVDVVFVIDHSLSMGRRTAAPGGGGGASTLYDNAISTAEEIVKMLPQNSAGDSAAVGVILAEHSPRVVTALPVSLRVKSKGPGQWKQVLQQLREMKAGTTDANIPQAVQAAGELVARGSNLKKVIIVLSDDQRANWRPADETSWRATLAAGGAVVRSVTKAGDQAIPVYSFPLAANAPLPNVSISNVHVTPAFLGVHRQAQITAALTNTSCAGADIANVPVQLMVDGQSAGGEGNQLIPRLAPGQTITLRFTHSFDTPGSHWVRVRSELIDGLDADNAATAAVSVSPRLPILIVDGQLTPARSYPAAEYLLLAMQPSDPAVLADPSALMVPRVISVSEIDNVRLEDYAIVVLNDVPRLPSNIVARLTDFAQKGNGLWIILGPRTDLAFLNETLAKSPLFPAKAAAPVHIPANQPPATADIKEPENAAFAPLTAAQQNALAGVTFRAWWPVVPRSPELHTVLATAANTDRNADPLILETTVGKISGGGRVIVWTSPDAGYEWNNLFISGGAVVPLVNETLFHLASGHADIRQLANAEPLTWTGPVRPVIETATLITPEGASRTLQPQLRGDKYLIEYKETYAPGLYELRFSSPEVPQPIFFSASLPRDELDPTVLSSADLDWLREHRYVKDRLSMETLATALSAQHAGFELWWLLAVLVMVGLFTEVLMTWRLTKRQTEIDPETAGLIAPVSRTVSAGGLR